MQSTGGVATAKLKLGDKTDKNPYYLVFPGEQWAQRADLTVIKAEVNGYGMTELFYEFGRPDDVTQLLTPFGATIQGWPHVSVGTPVLVLPADQFQNPVANQEVTFSLSASPPGPGKGPELVSQVARAACGGTTQMLAGECVASGQRHRQGLDQRGLGLPDRRRRQQLHRDRHRQRALRATSPPRLPPTCSSTSPPATRWAGRPCWSAGRAQPVSLDGSESIEAYPPGKPSLPLKVSLLVIHEEFSVVSCSGRWCTQPTGKYKTRRLATTPIEGCFPTGCGGGQLTESGQVVFSGDGISGTQSSPVSAGVYEQAVTMPANPGRYPVRAKPSVRVAVPKKPSSPAFPNEVVPCNGGGCGAVLELKDLSDPGWYIDFLLWAVRGKVTGTPPIVKLGHEYRHETETLFPYTIEPEGYKALAVGDGLHRGRHHSAAGLRRRPRPGPRPPCRSARSSRSRPAATSCRCWSIPAGSGSRARAQPVSLMIEGEKTPFKVIQFDVDLDSDNTNGNGYPDRNDAEENIEEDGGPTGFGKFVFVNHDNDDAAANDEPPGLRPAVGGERRQHDPDRDRAGAGAGRLRLGPGALRIRRRAARRPARRQPGRQPRPQERLPVFRLRRKEAPHLPAVEDRRVADRRPQRRQLRQAAQPLHRHRARLLGQRAPPDLLARGDQRQGRQRRAASRRISRSRFSSTARRSRRR